MFGFVDVVRGIFVVVFYDEGNLCRICWGSEDVNNVIDWKVEGWFFGYYEDVIGVVYKLVFVVSVCG